MNYLDSNLVTLNTNLFRSNFDRILDSIWVEVLEEMREVLDTEDVVNRIENQLDLWLKSFEAVSARLCMPQMQYHTVIRTVIAVRMECFSHNDYRK